MHGQPIYVIREESGWLGRVCIGSSRSFKMSIYDRQGREALLIKRPLSFIGDVSFIYYEYIFSFVHHIKYYINMYMNFDFNSENGGI